jgi:hypothetical protein
MWPEPLFRYWLIDRWNAATAWVLDRVLEGRATSPTAQILRFPDRGGLGRFGFTFWAFPEQKYPEILSAYFDFCREHKKRSGYRTNLPHVSYRIARDQNALLSYSHDHVVATLDPAASPSAGFDDFLRAFNKFAIDRGGKPMLNQTKWLDAELLLRAYGERWRAFAQIRQQWDPEDRFLSAHFRALLPDHPPEEADLAAE